MIVLMDMEWVQNSKRQVTPTQLSAVRVDAAWPLYRSFMRFAARGTRRFSAGRIPHMPDFRRKVFLTQGRDGWSLTRF